MFDLKNLFHKKEEAKEVRIIRMPVFNKFEGEAKSAMTTIALGQVPFEVYRNGVLLGKCTTRLLPDCEDQIYMDFGETGRICSEVLEASFGSNGEIHVSTRSGAKYEFRAA